MDHLPDDLLADILRRLPPRGAAACRTVCKGWSAVVDAGGLLLAVARLVPRPMRGFFVNYNGHNGPYFYSRGPTARPSIAFEDPLRFMRRVFPHGDTDVHDHRNGLILYGSQSGSRMFVCNPVTRRWADVPPHPSYTGEMYLVFDPIASLHWDVFFFRKRYPEKEKVKNRVFALFQRRNKNSVAMEWPPSPYMVQVYSSRTGRWEDMAFLREGSATTVPTWSDLSGNPKRHAVYWRGALYLHCRSGLIIRFTLDKKTYLVIGPPKIVMMPDPYGFPTNIKPQGYLGKSTQGVYYTTIYHCQLQAWVLLEASKSRPIPEWVLKHHCDLAPFILRQYIRPCHEGKKTAKSRIVDPGKEGVPDDRADSEWEFSDDHSVDDPEETETAGQMESYVHRRIHLLGYHPYRDIAFLLRQKKRDIAFLDVGHSDAFAYYLETSKLRHLGPLKQAPTAHESFIYTPCEDDLLPNEPISDTAWKAWMDVLYDCPIGVNINKMRNVLA